MSEYSRKFEASPWFRASNSAAVAANAYYAYDFEQVNGARKYLPFDTLTVDNASSATLSVMADGNPENSYNIPANASRTFTKKDFPGLSRVLLLNTSSATTINAGEVVVTAQRSAYSTDRAVPALHRAIFGRLG